MIRIFATGDYSHPLKEALVMALKESIETHMTAYGLTHVCAVVSEVPGVTGDKG